MRRVAFPLELVLLAFVTGNVWGETITGIRGGAAGDTPAQFDITDPLGGPLSATRSNILTVGGTRYTISCSVEVNPGVYANGIFASQANALSQTLLDGASASAWMITTDTIYGIDPIAHPTIRIVCSVNGSIKQQTIDPPGFDACGASLQFGVQGGHSGDLSGQARAWVYTPYYDFFGQWRPGFDSHGFDAYGFTGGSFSGTFHTDVSYDPGIGGWPFTFSGQSGAGAKTGEAHADLLHTAGISDITDLSGSSLKDSVYFASGLTFSPVPEPSTWTAIIGGITVAAGIGFWRLRRGKEQPVEEEPEPFFEE